MNCPPFAQAAQEPLLPPNPPPICYTVPSPSLEGEGKAGCCLGLSPPLKGGIRKEQPVFFKKAKNPPPQGFFGGGFFTKKQTNFLDWFIYFLVPPPLIPPR